MVVQVTEVCSLCCWSCNLTGAGISWSLIQIPTSGRRFIFLGFLQFHATCVSKAESIDFKLCGKRDVRHMLTSTAYLHHIASSDFSTVPFMQYRKSCRYPDGRLAKYNNKKRKKRNWGRWVVTTPQSSYTSLWCNDFLHHLSWSGQLFVDKDGLHCVLKEPTTQLGKI